MLSCVHLCVGLQEYFESKKICDYLFNPSWNRIWQQRMNPIKVMNEIYNVDVFKVIIKPNIISGDSV